MPFFQLTSDFAKRVLSFFKKIKKRSGELTFCAAWFVVYIVPTTQRIGWHIFLWNIGTATRRLALKGALSCYSVFLCWFFFFCGRKWRRGDLRPRRRPTSRRALAAIFFHLFYMFEDLRLIDVVVSVSCPCKVTPLSLSRTKLGFEIWSRKWKDKFAHQQWWKIHGTQNRLAELDGSILSCASFGKIHGRHYFSPQQNGAKNHWIAWQCTFKRFVES